MPKLKTKKGVQKRFKLTSSGKVKRQKESARHLLTKKSRKKKRTLKASTTVHKSFAKKIRSLMPYA